MRSDQPSANSYEAALEPDQRAALCEMFAVGATLHEIREKAPPWPCGPEAGKKPSLSSLARWSLKLRLRRKANSVRKVYSNQSQAWNGNCSFVTYMNFSRRRAMVWLAALAMASSAPGAFAADPEFSNSQDYLRINYNLQVIIQSEDRAIGNLRLGRVTNTAQMEDYLRALTTECQKYPADFFSRAGVSEVILCGNLHMGRAPIAGLFNEQKKKLYMQFHWCRFGARCRESFHAFHHELGHALQSASWGDGHYDWRDWAALNPPGFHYGNGGNQELMANPEKNFGTWSTNQPGFLNAYSATAPWEDRSEIMAALMNDGDRRYLAGFCRRDPILQRKVELISDLLSKFCGPADAKYFWEQSVDSLAPSFGLR